jgi:hypothetical protein
LEFLVCDGTWIRAAGGYLDCDGTVSTMTLQEVRDVSFAQMTAEQKAQLTSSLLGFFCLIFVLIKLRRIT